MRRILWAVSSLFVAVAVAQAAVPEAARNGIQRYFDIRESNDKADSARLEILRGRNPAARVRARAMSKAMQAEIAALEQGPRGLTMIRSSATGAPAVVAPGRGQRALTGPRDDAPERIARDFIEGHASAFGLSRAQAAQLRKDADYANPAQNLKWVRLQQRIKGRPVFRGEVTLALTFAGEVIRASGELAPAIDEREAPTRPVISAAEAVAIAAKAVEVDISAGELAVISGYGPTEDDRIILEGGPFSANTEVRLVYFPVGDGSVELAWSIVMWFDDAAYYSIVGASSGIRLFQKNIQESAPNSYRVYPSDSPAPLSPGPNDPNLGTQGALVPQSLVAVDSTVSTNDPWLPAGVTVTDGNNVEAGLDIDGIDGVDAPVAATAPGVFDYIMNPPPGDPAPGDPPTTAANRAGAVVTMFYHTNVFHDRLYDLGFTEQARNFQDDNYGRGGAAGDRIRAEGQDSSGTNNANFSTPADGGRGRMQMFRFTGMDPDRDGTVDIDVVYHELAHGLSNRLHANASGLGTNMARGMGEGWSDFYAVSLLSEPTDPVDAIYAVGGYVTLNITSGFTGNYYYGIRRFPLAPITFRGGPGNNPHNPLTFADIDSTQMDLTNGAFPRGPIGSSRADQVHNAGEIWSSALWEARANLIRRLGTEAGNERMLQLVTDGMKLNPTNPTFLESRDSIIAAACASDPADELDVWNGFAARGMGLNAQVLSISPARVVEDFTGPSSGGLPLNSGSVSFDNASCPLPDRNPTQGETVTLQFEISNPFCSLPYTNLVVTTDGGGVTSIGDLAAGATVVATVDYTIPTDAACGTTSTATIGISSDQGSQTFEYDVPVGESPLNVNTFSNTSPIQIPTINTTSGPADPYPSSIDVSGITDPVIGARIRLEGLNHTWPDDIDMLLVAPSGESFVVLSDRLGSNDLINVSLTLRDDAAEIAPSGHLVPADGSASYRPSNPTAGDTFDPPAPAEPYAQPEPAGNATFASVFSGVDPNGAWHLFIDDDAGADTGSITGGWTLEILTAQDPFCIPCQTAEDTFTSISSSLNPSTFADNVTFTATVTDGVDPVVGGSVGFIDGGSCASPAAVLAADVMTDVNGEASFTTDALAAGGHDITACFAEVAGTFNASEAMLTQQVNPAPTVPVINCPAAVTYDGSAQMPCDASVSGPGGFTQPLIVSYADNVNAGTAAATATFSGTANYEASSISTTFEIEPAASSVAISCPAEVIYDGTAQTPCTATVTGVGGLNAPVTVDYADNVNAGTATATAIYPGGANHASSSASATFAIGLAPTSTSLDCPILVTYDGTAQMPCSARVTGPGGLDLALPVAYTNNVNVGVASAIAEYLGDANYFGSAATTAFTIGQAASVTTVSCPASVEYTGLAQTPCTALVTGPGGLDESLSVSYADNIVAGIATASASFAGTLNHAPSSGSTPFTIDKATLTVTPDNVTKDYLVEIPPLTYSINGFVNGETVAVVSGAPDCSTTATQFSVTGDYPITCSIGTLAAANYDFSFVAGTLTVLPRDALARYIGETMWVTSGSSSTTAQVSLTASFQDPTGAGFVDATVSFIDAMTGSVLAKDVPVSPVAAEPATGTANAIVTLSTGQYGAESYLILVKMTGNYDNAEQPIEDKTATIVVAQPGTDDSTVGAGSYVALDTRAGSLIGNGSDVGFSIGLTYNKKGKQLQGQATLAIPQDNGVIYVKSNRTNSMLVTPGTPTTSTIYAKASIFKVQQDETVISIDGNVTLRIDVVDGAVDQIGFTALSSKDGELYYSNQWVLEDDAWRTVPQSLETGFLSVN